MNLGSDVVITITGIVLVFAILVLLMAIVTLEGKIFDGMNVKKAAAKAAVPKAPEAKPAAPVQRQHPLLWWRRGSPVMWLPRSWQPFTPWAMASTPSRPCAAAAMAGARPVSMTPPHLFNTGGRT